MAFTRTVFIFILALLGMLAVANAAQVYKSVDKDGNVVFSDEPPTDAEAEEIEIAPHDPPSTPTMIGKPRPKQVFDPDAKTIDEEQLDTLIAEQEADLQRRCNEARVALEVLHQGMPVYRVGDGAYRAAWAGDAYTGPRQYLSDAQRENAIRGELRKLVINCEDPRDAEAQNKASDDWVDAERCAAARADLNQIKSPGSRAPDQEVQEHQKLVDRYCRN